MPRRAAHTSSSPSDAIDPAAPVAQDCCPTASQSARVAFTRFDFPGRPTFELMLIAPYEFAEWEEAMFTILQASAWRQNLRLFVDPRGTARPTNDFVESLVQLFVVHRARLAGARAAVLVSNGAGIGPGPEPLVNLQVGGSRIRTFHEIAPAALWLGPDVE
jgi:hypothetical protein